MSYRASQLSNDTKPDKSDHRERKVRQTRIGDQLRRLYDEVTTEPVPDEFLNLLEQADQTSSTKTSTKK